MVRFICQLMLRVLLTDHCPLQKAMRPLHKLQALLSSNETVMQNRFVLVQVFAASL